MSEIDLKEQRCRIAVDGEEYGLCLFQIRVCDELPDAVFTRLPWSYCSKLGDCVPIAFVTWEITASILLGPSSRIDSLQTRLRCSRCKPAAMFHPCNPCVFTNLHHTSFSD